MWKFLVVLIIKHRVTNSSVIAASNQLVSHLRLHDSSTWSSHDTPASKVIQYHILRRFMTLYEAFHMNINMFIIQLS